MSGARRIGTGAEDRAADFLLAKGYVVLRRRYKGGGGELDLVLLDGDTLVFAEVKRRNSFAEAVEAVDSRKVDRIVAAAEAFAFEVGEHERPRRFDLIVVLPDRIEHLVAALES
ncbi:MAG: YraN family protein [Fimbriimonadaceae bacterium]|nr:YraN family protein [Fimbriimonadaceae bacterium]